MFRAYILSTGDTDAARLTAASHIDMLTFNRIQDFQALTTAQQEKVTEAYEQLQQFEAENAELLSSPVKSYSVNGVSMTFGGSGLKNVCGVVIPTSVYQLLVQTGLCNPAI